MGKIIMIGGCYHPGAYICDDEKIDFAAHALFFNIINEIKDKENLIIVNDIRRPTFPHSVHVINKHHIQKENNTVFDDFFYINAPLLKQFTKTISVILTCNKYIKMADKAIIYSMHTPYLAVAPMLKRFGVKEMIIIPDLPMYMDTRLKQKPLKYLLKRMDFCIQKQLLRSADKYVLIAEKMQDDLGVSTKECIVVEGMYDENSLCSKTSLNFIDLGFSKLDEENLVVCYSGSTNIEYGLKFLVDSFNYLTHDNVELWIFGKGDYDESLRLISKEKPNIRFFGAIPSDQLHIIQSSVDLLINPRQGNKEYTKYSFPSKTLEYLASGTPSLCYKLRGIPDEYDPYLNYIKGVDPEDAADSIERVLFTDRPNAEIKAIKGQEFVLNNKTAHYQVKRIMEFFDED